MFINIFGINTFLLKRTEVKQARSKKAINCFEETKYCRDDNTLFSLIDGSIFIMRHIIKKRKNNQF